MKLDTKITKTIQDWLNTSESERDIKAGADLLLSLNRNRALYNSLLRNPSKFAPKLVYELKKHLRIRLDKMTIADIVHLEKRVMPSVAEIAISSDAELPAASLAHGRRSDHDSLPAEIQDLWDSNAERHQRIVILFNELKAMQNAMPCDRYEKLVVLDELDKKYRSNLEKYDNFSSVGGSSTLPIASKDATEVNTDNSKTISAARKTLSKYRKLIVSFEPDDPRRQAALEKIQNSVDALTACDAGVADDTRSELVALGIKFS